MTNEEREKIEKNVDKLNDKLMTQLELVTDNDKDEQKRGEAIAKLDEEILIEQERLNVR